MTVLSRHAVYAVNMTRADADPAAGRGAAQSPDGMAASPHPPANDPQTLREAYASSRSRRDYTAALEYAMRISQIPQVRREGHVRLAETLILLRRFDDATAALSEAADADPIAFDTLLCHSNLHRATHSRAEALDVAQTMMIHFPRRPTGYLRAAIDLVCLGRRREARDVLSAMPASLIDRGSPEYAEAVQKAFGIADGAGRVAVDPHNPGPTSSVGRPASYLFVSGLPRSGTSALGRLLNLSPEVALYTELLTDRAPYAASSFDDDFVSRKIAGKRSGRGVHGIFEKSRGARWIGDKRPHFLKFAPATFDHMAEQEVTVVHIVRSLPEVALSYEVRASNPEDRFWSPMRNSDEAVADAIQASDYLVELASHGLRPRHRVLVVPYERVFGHAHHALAVYEALGVSVDAALERKLAGYLAKSAGVLGRARDVPEWMRQQVDAAKGHRSVAEVDEMLRGCTSFVELGGVERRDLTRVHQAN
jgi:hypothetical protein